MNICKQCRKEFPSKYRGVHIFCSHSCSAIYNNLKRGVNKGIEHCLNCNVSIEIKRYRSSKRSFCSPSCSQEYRSKDYIEKWLRGEVSGSTKKDSQLLSKYVRNYLLKESNYSCSLCSWSMKNEYTNTIPLEIDHIDGHSENNLRENLRVLCPNCHSLTPYFGILNKGNGRRFFRKLWKEETKK